MGTRLSLNQISGLTETLEDINIEISTEETRLDSILSGTTSDLDSLSEIVSYINSIDSVNDSELSISMNNSSFVNGDYLDGGSF
jgi:hypothetical protein